MRRLARVFVSAVLLATTVVSASSITTSVFAQSEPDSNDTTAPTTPSGLRFSTRIAYAVTLTWNVSTDSGGSGVAGYDIYKGSTLIASTSATNFKDIGLSERTAYAYRIQAYDNDDNTSPLTSIVNVTTPVKGDLNGDGKIGIVDLSRVAGSYKQPGNTLGDTDGDGDTDIIDLSIIAGKYNYEYTLP